MNSSRISLQKLKVCREIYSAKMLMEPSLPFITAVINERRRNTSVLIKKYAPSTALPVISAIGHSVPRATAICAANTDVSMVYSSVEVFTCGHRPFMMFSSTWNGKRWELFYRKISEYV